MVRYLIIGFLSLGPLFSLGQKSLIYDDINRSYKKGLELFDHEKYVVAQKQFDRILSSVGKGDGTLAPSSPLALIIMNAEYYRALCAVELYNNDADALLIQFIEKNYESTKVRLAYYQLGRYYFLTKKCKKAIPWLEKVELTDLTQVQITEFKFQSGYCYFFVKDLKNAKRLFAEIKDIKNKYYYPANYYYGYIALMQKNYNDALNSFLKIAPSKMYGRTAPFFICQTYYGKKDYDNLIKYAETYINDPKLKNYNEINFLAGNGYFEKGDYNKAVTHLKIYIDNSHKASREDIYRFAFAQYQIGNYEDAIKKFLGMTKVNDSLSQNVLYNIADCYLKTNDKQNARNAFSTAANMQNDPMITEMSSFYYAKLSFELGFHKLAINAIQKFITKYPKSDRKVAAQELLTDIFLTTRDYKEAIRIIESVKDKSPKIILAYQKVAYYQAVLYFRDRKYTKAISHFELSLKNPVEIELQALSYFWKGEIFFMQKKYKKAAADLSRYKTLTKLTEDIPKGSSLAKANYTLGYCYLKQSNFRNGLGHFLECITLLQEEGKIAHNKVLIDATQRTADAYFMLKNYPKAIEYYDMTIENKYPGSDYAYYQKGILHGLSNEHNAKIAAMAMIKQEFPNSIYNDDAIFEIGNSYLLTDRPREALESFNSILTHYPNSNYVRKCYVNLGLIYFNLNEIENALTYYKEVVQKYPKSHESREAVLGIKALYISIGKAEEYIHFLESVPDVKISASEVDSVTYLAAETIFKKGDCNASIISFSDYLQKFPDGFFALEVHFYRGECYYSVKNYKKGLQDYDYVINEPKYLFTEQSLLKAARINYFINKDYGTAMGHYKKLHEIAAYKENQYEALFGILRSAYYTNQQHDVFTYAPLIESSELATVEDKLELYYYLGMVAMQNNNLDTAMLEFTKIVEAANNERAAESKYNIAIIQFKRGDFESSIASCFSVIKQVPSYYYWVIKSYILLADNYTEKGEIFQAKATLQSIIDNYKDDELLNIAEEKLFKIMEIEREAAKIESDTSLPDSLLDIELLIPGYKNEIEQDTIIKDLNGKSDQ